MSFARATLLLAALSSVLGQSSSGLPSGASSNAGGATGVPAAGSIDPNLPQTPLASNLPSGASIPPLSALTSGAPSGVTVALDTTYSKGVQPTAVSGAPATPTGLLTVANYPPLDLVPSTSSPEVQQWLSRIDFSKVPSYNQTTGVCSTSPGAISDGRCWWTCGGCTRATDIVSCPDKLTWGTSYDDGPSPYTPLLLDYLNANNLKTTFFVVGSRVLSRPEMVLSEYVSGHQLSIHTWSHPMLTTLTNEQVVAELGWTAKVIRDVTGVTPNTFRPPYGDIDDRVRAIAAQMGLTPVLWSSVTVNNTATNFDTTDWNIPGNRATGETALGKFETILNTYVPLLNTGFIVLQHDIYQQTVDLAVGYILPMAIASGKYKLQSIIQCLGKPLSEAYIETSSNNTQTRITAASSGSVFQPMIGSGTFAAAATTSGSGSSGASASMTASRSSSSGSAGSAAAAATSSRSAAGKLEMSKFNLLPALVAGGAIVFGAALIM